MQLSVLSIRRPVLATVFNLVIVLMGIVAWQRLQLREYPNIDTPTISVETTWRGASAEIMETQVTKVLEDSISGIEGVDYISSTSRAEDSQINVVFHLTRDADVAAADVRDRVGRVRSMLPDAVDEPVIAKTEADATPIIYLALSSPNMPAMDVTDIASRVVKDRLQTLPGVASARIFGEREYSMRLWLDPQKLAAFSLTPDDVIAALQAQNIEVPSGRIEGPDREFTVLSETDLRTPEQFRAIILKQGNGYLVRVGDVARVEVAPSDTRVVARFNNEESVAIGIVKQSTANPLEVSRAVAKEIDNINTILPAGVTLKTAYDSTVFIDASLGSVYHTLGEAIALVAVVVLLFLRSPRASIIPLITIPISLLGALVLMYALGFSLNTLTLLAFVLAIGLVVDDAIVMLENISRYIEEGLSPTEAALKGSKEIGFAVLAMTLTLAAVFAPIGMAQGTTGKLFSEFALALAGAVVVSGFIALTLTPMLCAQLLRHSEPGAHRASAFSQIVDRVLTPLHRFSAWALRFKPLPPQYLHEHEVSYVSRYRYWLDLMLARPRKVVTLAGVCVTFAIVIVLGVGTILGALTGGATNKAIGKQQEFFGSLVQLASKEMTGMPSPELLQFAINGPKAQVIPAFVLAKPITTVLGGLPRELAPTEDRGFFIGVGFAPEGSTIEYTTRYARMIEDLYAKIPERNMNFVITGFPVVNQLLSFVAMKDWSERDRSVRKIAAELGMDMFGVPGLLAFPVNPASLGQGFLSSPITFIVQTTGTWADLEDVTEKLMARVAMNPGIQNMRSDLQLNKPELRLTVNRDKVADTGVGLGAVGRTLETLIGGSKVTRFKQGGEQYDVIVQVADEQRRQPSDLTGIFVRNPQGHMIQLSNLVNVEEDVAPKELNHFSKLRAATITASVAPGYSLGEALTFMNQAVKDIGAVGVSVDYGASSREYMRSSSSFLFVFVLALAFIFLVLAAQFESFVDPFIIMLAVPLALAGGIIALTFTGNSINIYSQIGLVTLVGLIAKNGILIVEFANQLQEKGLARIEAVKEAAALRLRPILMTTAATVLGAFPLAFATGAGAEARQTIGWVIVGGMTIGTFFTLFIVPLIYTKLAQDKAPLFEGHAEEV